MKTFETIRDVVDNAIAVHHLAADTYRRLILGTDNPRARLWLKHMAEHEIQMESGISNRKKAANDTRVLDVYIQYTLEESPQQFMDKLLAQYNEADLDDICAMSQEIGNYLVDLFEEALEEMESAKVSDFLKDLAEYEALERRHLTQTIHSLSDM